MKVSHVGETLIVYDYKVSSERKIPIDHENSRCQGKPSKPNRPHFIEKGEDMVKDHDSYSESPSCVKR